MVVIQKLKMLQMLTAHHLSSTTGPHFSHQPQPTSSSECALHGTTRPVVIELHIPHPVDPALPNERYSQSCRAWKNTAFLAACRLPLTIPRQVSHCHLPCVLVTLRDRSQGPPHRTNEPVLASRFYNKFGGWFGRVFRPCSHSCLHVRGDCRILRIVEILRIRSDGKGRRRSALKARSEQTPAARGDSTAPS